MTKVTMEQFSDLCDSITGSADYQESGSDYAVWVIFCARDQINPSAEIEDLISDFDYDDFIALRESLEQWNNENKDSH